MTSILKFGLTEDLGERERGRFFDLTILGNMPISYAVVRHNYFLPTLEMSDKVLQIQAMVRSLICAIDWPHMDYSSLSKRRVDYSVHKQLI